MKRASRTRGVFAVIGLVALLAARAAHAEDEPQTPAAVAPAPAEPVTIQVATPAGPAPETARPSTTATSTRTDLWKISAGPRINYVSSAGMHPFSEGGVLASFSLEGQYPILSRGRFAVGLGLGYAGGGTTSKMRGNDTSLVVHTFQVPIEGRIHFGRAFYSLLRVAPGTTALYGSVNEVSSPNKLEDWKWAFSTDVTIGSAILLGPRGPDQVDRRTVRFWAIPEVGATFATNARFDLRPDRSVDDVLGTDQRTALPALNLSSFFWRLSLATTF